MIQNPRSESGSQSVTSGRMPILVHSLREWLTHKQKETRRGRAELHLADRAALWNAKPENRQLPSLWEFLNIRFLTDRKKWTAAQCKMMAKAGRVHGLRGGIVAVVLGIFTLSAVAVSRQIDGETPRRLRHAALVERTRRRRHGQEVPAIVQKLAGYRRWADPLLLQEYTKAAQGSNRKLHLALALVPVDDAKIAELRDDLAQVSPTAFALVRDALLTHRDRVIEPLWSVALDAKRGAQERFQAGCALGRAYALEDPRWNQINAFVAGRLVTLEASALVAWQKALASRQAAVDQATCRDLWGHNSRETLSHLCHGDFGGLCC